MTQRVSLSRIFKQKLSKKSNIDVTEFNVTQAIHEVQTLAQEGLKEKDLVDSLPGQPSKVSFKQYAGYVTVDQKAGRAFFYYFVEAQRSPDKSPLLFWLNGGPGCSSLGFGAMEEIGPFRVNNDGKTLHQNPYAWNYVANVLFLESPAGVGFSYSNTTSNNLTTGDTNTAKDNYTFLLNWMRRFPEYKNREFYIAGESYAGHYVPQLAQTIMHHNKKPNNTIIKLKGVIIGNAVIDDETDTIGQWEYYGSHALNSDVTVSKALKYCNFSYSATKQPRECEEAVEDSGKEAGDDIDPYNIYAPLCTKTILTKNISAMHPDPCSARYIHAYLNREEVQKELHANIANTSYVWQNCSDVVLNNWNQSSFTVIPILKEIMANGIRLWIYSGDIDGVVPVTSTQLSIKKMKLHIQTRWHPWYLQEEVGGYTQVYHNLTFATVRGAGHEVPKYQPQRSFYLISSFIAGKPL
ncbi:Serine carboxypeptidase-like 40 [Striga hermonthica]|uniref:Carboxypeptidase n=1 Tax=Striga hermonthica TaxID=68872 RepID=A0A9N7RGM9_STRHE|nr:Serine carboxypeptidase-like 40 [Striga hermonthica]